MYRAVMQVKNTGSVMAEFCFVPKLNETEVSKSWLKFSPMDGILAPEETCEVEVLVILNLEEAYEIATTKANVSLM
jgi:phosphatidylinositol-bisphosphatase